MSHKSFFEQSSSIHYNQTDHKITKYTGKEEITLHQEKVIHWLNTYGITYIEAFKDIINKNNLDEFIIKVIKDADKTNKVLSLDNCVLLSINVLKTESQQLDTERMFFVSNAHFLWSIQEKKGDYFENIRERLENNTGFARKKKADYLLYLLLESIIDHYQETYNYFSNVNQSDKNPNNISPTPLFMAQVGKRKQNLFKFKRATASLRDAISKLEKSELKELHSKYFTELKEQANNLLSDIDFDLQELESSINMIFSIQGHRLNSVMKTLTIFSVIFIPLTFIAGIYGMNFKYIPGTETKHSFYALLITMAIISALAIYYFKKKKWF